METIEKKLSKAPKMKGSVVSNKMNKTIVVAVETLKTHPKYLKKYTSTKRYKVHTGDKKYEIGDTVVFQECRPISRDKRHEIVL
jgi:small subunit ribosomal protein S17